MQKLILIISMPGATRAKIFEVVVFVSNKDVLVGVPAAFDAKVGERHLYFPPCAAVLGANVLQEFADDLRFHPREKGDVHVFVF
jgi:hypothetical protein